MRAAAGATLACAAMLAAGCGEGGETGRTTQPADAPPSTPAALEPPLRDAEAARNALVRLVLGHETAIDPVDALVESHPGLRFGSRVAPADAAGVSIWWTPLDPYSPERPDNPTLFLVAVRDQAGACAIGAATGVGVFEEGLTAEGEASPCTAEGARRRLGLGEP